MKDSILEGAANSAPVQSKNNSPSGSTKEAKGRDGGRTATVVLTVTSRNPSSVKGNAIGLNVGNKDKA